MHQTLAIRLAGGSGLRLSPLTEHRAKPAVPFGGKYRIIDFTLSNCLHSGIRQILVLTQYKSHSLQKHLRDGWSLFNPEMGEFITTVPPQMRTGQGWYTGTADAIYQNLYLLERNDAPFTLILAGDHIYRMDYAQMLQSHPTQNATLQSPVWMLAWRKPVPLALCRSMPSHEFTVLKKNLQPEAMPGDESRALVSMGIYLFSKDTLIKILTSDHERKIPAMISAKISFHSLSIVMVLPPIVLGRRKAGYPRTNIGVTSAPLTVTTRATWLFCSKFHPSISIRRIGPFVATLPKVRRQK